VEQVSGGVDVHVRGFYRHQADSPTSFPCLPPVRCGVSRGLENLTGTFFYYPFDPQNAEIWLSDSLERLFLLSELHRASSGAISQFAFLLRMALRPVVVTRWSCAGARGRYLILKNVLYYTYL
jgi:hypothetical protein